jgi:serine phosphatase RsbU (regulator of sigma subunit)/anti-sigma regulatory factor (Ser/Thr protein kinase)
MGRQNIESHPVRALVALLPRGGSLPPESWVRRHRGVVTLLWVHAAIIPVYALAMGYPVLHSVAEGLVVPTAAAVASMGGLSRRIRTMAASVALLSSSAVLVHLSGGLIEMHFHFFVMVVVVSLYQDWQPFLAAIGYVFVHHGVLGAIDPASVFNHPAALEHPWRWAAVHAFFVMGTSVACLVNWRLNEAYLAQRRRAEARLREESRIVERLDEVGRMLASDLELDHVVQRVTDVATELTSAELGAFFYNVSDESGDSLLLYSLSGVPAEAFAEFAMPRATSLFGATFSGESVVRLDDVTADARYGQNPPYRGMPPGHPPVRSYLAVPVIARGTVIGGLFFGHSEVGRFTDAEERVALGIAAHAAVAVSNARLYDAERRAREQEEEARERLAIVADAGRRLLSSSLDADAAMTELAPLVVPRLADGCRIDIVGKDGRLRRAVTVIRDHAMLGVECSEGRDLDPGDRDHPVVRVLRNGHGELFEPGSSDLDRLAGTGVADGSAPLPEPPISAVVVPFPGRDGALGVMTLVTHRSSGRQFDGDDLELADVLARRAALAAEKAAVFAAHRAAAETLQHSLLPDRLPVVPAMEMAARYLPGSSGVEVGGDWYDVIALPDGTVGLALGDVVGKGVPAASLMGQLRNSLRAYARDGRSPAEILELLNDLLSESDSLGHMATLVYGVFDPGSGSLTWANAGHPPPLLRRPDGTVTFVQGESGLPLGALPDSRYADSDVRIGPGSTLLFYTDGLVEGRKLPLDEGMERLRSSVVGELDCEDLCETVLAQCWNGQSTSDDTALLAVRYLALGEAFQLSLPARPGSLQPLRSVLRRWLREGGASEKETFDVLVATCEACANVVRHAPASDATFELDIRRDGDLCVTVRNHGGWRENGHGGRGLLIMDELMDEVVITRGPPETVVTMRRSLGERPAPSLAAPTTGR